VHDVWKQCEHPLAQLSVGTPAVTLLVYLNQCHPTFS
jgi:hypothetical protein